MIALNVEAQQTIIDEAINAYPGECAGFLFGHQEENRRRVVTQVVQQPSLQAAEEYAEQQKLQLLGQYRSRPDHPAIPGLHDRSAAQPSLSYLIIPINNGRPGYLRSWILNEEGNFEEENNHLIAL